MIALRQIKRVHKNYKYNKIKQLKEHQHGALFLNDMQAVSDDFISVDNEAW